MFKSKIEAIPFREFMAGHHSNRKEKPRTRSIYTMSLFFPALTPESFFPVHDTGFLLFVLGGVAVVGSVFFERLSARLGSPLIAEVISGVSRVALPVIVYGSVFWFLFSL